ncbi:hypothetical protein ACXYL9_06120 [Qipengyuania sp. CAU 1752]
MMKFLVMLVVGVIAFLVAFAFTARDEIADEVSVRSANSFSERCVARFTRAAPDPSRAAEICGCMETQFAARGIELTDAFTGNLQEMRDITRACAGGGRVMIAIHH